MRKLIVLIFLFNLVLISCTKDNSENSTHSINGKVQKGPFLIGTEVRITELDKKLNPTGSNFFANITDDLGSFSVPDVKFNSDFVIINADGAYFNELDSAINNDLVLNCLASLKDGEAINVNILTHLTKDRILKLVADGKSFENARAQANSEFLKIFNLENYQIALMDKLDLTNSSESNDILFALNMIIVGRLSDMELTEFLTKFINDFAVDGKLDNLDIQALMKSNALYSAANQSWSNLKARYTSLGITTGTSNSSKYVMEFFHETNFKGFFDVETPRSTPNGINLITLPDGDKLDTNLKYTIAITKSDATRGNIYLNLKTLDSESHVIFQNPIWHSYKNERVFWNFDNIDNAVKFKETGKIRLQYRIVSDKYATINVIKTFTW